VVGAAIAYVTWQPADHASVTAQPVRPVSPVLPDNDPWNNAAPPAPVVRELPLVEPPLSLETYRAEMAAAVARLPADTRFVFTAEVGELRAQHENANLLEQGAKEPRIQLLLGLLPPCVRATAAGSEWIAFGAPSLHDTATKGTVVLRGRWQREHVEACFADTAKHVTTADQHTMFKIGDEGWLDFIDDHTIYVAVASGLDAEALHALVRHGAGPGQHTRDLFARLPADRAIALAFDGAGSDDLSDALALPKGTDVFGWMRVEKGGVTLDVAADPHRAAAAQLAMGKLAPRIDNLFGESKPEAVGRLQVVTEQTSVHLRGNVTALMLSMIASSL
jgi:hypothetical protein